jgi:hypothetical protein
MSGLKGFITNINPAINDWGKQKCEGSEKKQNMVYLLLVKYDKIKKEMDRILKVLFDVIYNCIKPMDY